MAFDDFAADQVGVDDVVDVAGVDVGVPGAFGIQHQHRAFFAAVEAAGLVDADLARAIDAQFLDAFFRVLLGYFGALLAAARTTIVALVHAKEDVVLKELFAHVLSLLTCGNA